MDKKIKLLILSIFMLLFFGCGASDSAEDWSLPVIGLNWGMTVTEACTALELENIDQYIYEQITRIEVPACIGIFDVDMDVTLLFNEFGLFKIEGVFPEEHTDMVKNELIDMHGEPYYGNIYSSNKLKWESELVGTLEDKDIIVEQMKNWIKDDNDIAAVERVIYQMPLVSIELIEKGQRAGTLIIDGNYQLLVNRMREDL